MSKECRRDYFLGIKLAEMEYSLERNLSIDSLNIQHIQDFTDVL